MQELPDRESTESHTPIEQPSTALFRAENKSLLSILTDISFENAEHAEQKLGLSVNVSLRQFRQQKSFLASYRRTSGNKLEQVVDIGLDLVF